MLCSRCKKRQAVVFMTTMEGDKSKNQGLCLVCAKELGIGPVNEMIKSMGLDDEQIELLSDQMTDMFSENGEGLGDLFELGGAQTFPLGQNLGEKEDSEEQENDSSKKDKKSEQKKKKGKFKYLDSFCENLTKKAEEGRLDRIIGREKEIERVTQILCRRSKNNPCLIGEPGVGKTAIVEGIALKIVNGDIPARLADKQLYLLDLTSLVAGTQFRGQFESRIKGLIDEVKSAGNVILFIDEVHNLVGAGESEGSMNAANILKPALSRGEIQVIGATTFAEYRKYIEKDAALERRFQPVTVNEPSVSDTIDLVRGIKGYYEDYHNASVSDDIAARAVVLSERYITDRFLPDKAIDLIDEACAYASLRNLIRSEAEKKQRELKNLKSREGALSGEENVDFEALALVRSEICKRESEIEKIDLDSLRTEVTTRDLAGVIELWTGIPASKIEESERNRLGSVKDNLKAKIIGQDEAIDAVCRAITRNRAGLSMRKRPASFIFVGPTGVGKTELVRQLASELFDGCDPLIRLDMSEYMEKHAVSKIIGSPPGYVGYDEAGQLTEKVRRRPYSVILFDEIEKAHPDVMNILLQILDEGRITDAHGRTVNFEHTVIVMTSNAGSDKSGYGVGFNKSAQELAGEKAKKALSEFLRPEFIARVDEVVVFNPLSEENLVKIAGLMVSELEPALSERGIALSVDESALKEVCALSNGGKYAARDLRHVIRREIEDPIAQMYTESSEGSIKEFKVTAENGKIVVTKE
ncbi:MAG: ATP-dependent Clp protease ATP-binding subunit [Ruminococcaceae bacterium]|nr:ATP-dependent Clp protease ATP-binding subunit [Oscillospiraceae bacterium]